MAAQSFNQMANSKKTPRPAPIPASSDENGTDKEIRIVEDQLSTLTPRGNLTGTHSNENSISPEKTRKAKIEQGMLRLAQTVNEIALVCKSRTQIDSFDLLKAQSDYIGAALEQAYFIRSKF